MDRAIIKMDLIAETDKSTVSRLIYGDNVCFVIEDGFKANKVPGYTRIKGGEYRIVKRRQGTFYHNYKTRYGHTFVPELQDVPDFTNILIHIGNTTKDTKGCLLLNYGVRFDSESCIYRGSDSMNAYLDFFNWLDYMIEEVDVWISINRH